MKKSPPARPDSNDVAAPVKRPRGRPPSGKPQVPDAQRQAARRERLRKSEGRKPMSLMLQEQTIALIDALRGDETREAFIERLVAANARRRRLGP